MTRPAKIPFTPEERSPEEGGAWSKRLGRQHEPASEPPTEKQTDKKESLKTLPNHPVSPRLQKIIDESNERDTDPDSPKSDKGSGTLHGVPVKQKDEDDGEE